MDLSEWGTPDASFDGLRPKTWLRVVVVLLLVGGTVAGIVLAATTGLGGGRFILPLVAILAGLLLLVEVLFAHREAGAVGPDWYVQRRGVPPREQGFRVGDVVAVREVGGRYVRGRYVAWIEVRTAAGGLVTFPTVVTPATAAVRAGVARLLLASDADVDPAARPLLRRLAGGDDAA